MDETRSEAVFVSTTPALKQRLDAYAKRNHWSRSTAAVILIEHGLDQDDHDQERGADHR